MTSLRFWVVQAIKGRDKNTSQMGLRGGATAISGGDLEILPRAGDDILSKGLKCFIIQESLMVNGRYLDKLNKWISEHLLYISKYTDPGHWND